MFPQNAASKLPLSILETSPETLCLVQQLDFSSFSESDESKLEVMEVASASDDPFDSDDLEDLLFHIPPPGSVMKAENPFPGKLTQALQHHEKGTLPRTFPHATSQVQRPQETTLKSESSAFLEPLIEDECMTTAESDASTTEAYFSCKSDYEGDNSGAVKQPTLNTTAAEIAVKAKAYCSENMLDSSSKLSNASAHLSSPERLHGMKRARLSSPGKFQSYESQMQFRQFSTTSVTRDTKLTESARSRNPTIQLATQQKSLNLPTSRNLLKDEENLRELSKTVIAFRLSKEQNHVLELAKDGKSIFFTGSAGTGKSILLKSIIKALKDAKGHGAVAVTASTGLAACNIGGITLHSFAGIGLGKGDLNSLVKTVKKNRKVVNRWKDTEVLIIDEISMIDGKLFQNLDQIARKIRRNHGNPFGGIQIIVCGDFYQLPPVNKSEIQADGSYVKTDAIFAFESGAWDQALDHSIVLKEVFRQKGDQDFIDMLNDMRHGIVSPMAETEFRRLSRPLSCPEGIVPTELYATRFEVDRANSSKLQRLQGELKVYVARDGGSLPPAVRAQWLQNFLAPRELVLKENAQVMCIKNIDDTLVNGSLGKIIRFVDRDTYMCERIHNEQPDLDPQEFEETCKKERKSRSEESESDSVFNFLASKILTKDKSTTNEETNVPMKREMKNESDIKEDCSFVDSVETFSSSVFPSEIQQENTDRKLKFIKELQKTSNAEKYPLVRFLCPDGVTTRDHLMEPERWDIVDDKTDEVLVSRVQFPLMLAWALSIHKSQGQTLQMVRVDLSRIFENGQAYVALSRAVSRKGLQVLNFREDRVRAHPIVESFYSSLSSSEDIEHRGDGLEKSSMYQKR